MMNDLNVNYYLIIRVFREFWKSWVLFEEFFENYELDIFEREVGLEQDEELEEECKWEYD